MRLNKRWNMATKRALTAVSRSCMSKSAPGLIFGASRNISGRQILPTKSTSRLLSSAETQDQSTLDQHQALDIALEQEASSNIPIEELDESVPPLAQAFVNSPDFPIWLAPQRRLPTHDIPVCQLHFRSYHVRYLDFFVDFARRAAFAMNMPCSNPIHLPTQISRWTVLKSPFVHKKSQENFERRTHKRLIVIKDAHPDTVDAWLAYLRKDAYYGVGMKATLFRYEKTAFGDRLGEEARGRVRGRQSRKREATTVPTTVAQKAEELTQILEAEVAQASAAFEQADIPSATLDSSASAADEAISSEPESNPTTTPTTEDKS